MGQLSLASVTCECTSTVGPTPTVEDWLSNPGESWRTWLPCAMAPVSLVALCLNPRSITQNKDPKGLSAEPSGQATAEGDRFWQLLARSHG
jgi:hypothetical protein